MTSNIDEIGDDMSGRDSDGDGDRDVITVAAAASVAGCAYYLDDDLACDVHEFIGVVGAQTKHEDIESHGEFEGAVSTKTNDEGSDEDSEGGSDEDSEGSSVDEDSSASSSSGSSSSSMGDGAVWSTIDVCHADLPSKDLLAAN